MLELASEALWCVGERKSDGGGFRRGDTKTSGKNERLRNCFWWEEATYAGESK